MTLLKTFILIVMVQITFASNEKWEKYNTIITGSKDGVSIIHTEVIRKYDDHKASRFEKYYVRFWECPNEFNELGKSLYSISDCHLIGSNSQFIDLMAFRLFSNKHETIAAAKEVTEYATLLSMGIGIGALIKLGLKKYFLKKIKRRYLRKFANSSAVFTLDSLEVAGSTILSSLLDPLNSAHNEKIVEQFEPIDFDRLSRSYMHSSQRDRLIDIQQLIALIEFSFAYMEENSREWHTFRCMKDYTCRERVFWLRDKPMSDQEKMFRALL